MRMGTGFRLLKRSRDHGGINAIVIGPTGSGKTTFLLSKLASSLLERREYLFWRGLEFCQWTYLPPHSVKLLLDPTQEYDFIDRKKKRTIPLDKLGEYGLKWSYCYEIEDFYVKAELGKLNVVYTTNDNFREFCRFLTLRPDIEWISVFMDEIEKFAPANVEGDLWRKNLEFANTLAEFRKNFISFYCAAQDYGDIDYRVTNKMNYRVYLKGARVPRTKTIVYPKLTLKLYKNQAIIDGGIFAQTTFDKLKHHLYLVVKIKPKELTVISNTPSPL